MNRGTSRINIQVLSGHGSTTLQAPSPWRRGTEAVQRPPDEQQPQTSENWALTQARECHGLGTEDFKVLLQLRL